MWTKRLLSAVLAAVTLAGPARAVDEPRAEASQIAVGLFARTCLSHMAEAAKVRQTVADLNMVAMPPDMARPFLLGRDGQAYSAATNGTGFVVALPTDGLCMVYAQYADPVVTGTGFQELMTEFTADTFVMKPSGESQIDGRISRAWELVPAGAHLKRLQARFGAKRDYPALFEVGLTTAPAGGLFEAMMSTGARVVAKEKN